MANSAELREGAGKLLSDAGFRAKFAADPQAAAASMNVRLSADQVQRAKAFNGGGIGLARMDDAALRALAEKAARDEVHVAWGGSSA